MFSKKIGNTWEQECLDVLGKNDFFATKLKERSEGAPFDIVASKNNIFYAIESKEILNSSKFPTSRIEPNQRAAYKRLLLVKTDNYFFFFKCPDGIFILHANEVINSKEKQIDVKNGISFEKWVELCRK